MSSTKPRTSRNSRGCRSISTSASSSVSSCIQTKSPQSFSLTSITNSSPTLSQNSDNMNESDMNKAGATTKDTGEEITMKLTSPQPSENGIEHQGAVYRKQEDYIQNLTIELSVKESRRKIQREALAGCFEEFQEIRNRMKALQEELLTIDDEIESLEKKRARASAMMENDDDIGVNTQYAMNLTQLDVDDDRSHSPGDYSGHPTVDRNKEVKGRDNLSPQDLGIREESTRKTSITSQTTAKIPNSSLSINSDECINEPCSDGDDGSQCKVYRDDDEDAAIEDHYADEFPSSFDRRQNEVMECEEDNYYIPEEEGYNGFVVNSYAASDGHESNCGNVTKDCFAPTLSFSTMDDVHKAAIPAGLVKTSSISNSSKNLQNGRVSTIDKYFVKPISSPSHPEKRLKQNTTLSSAPTSSLSIFPPSLQQRYNTIGDASNKNNNLFRHSQRNDPKDLRSDDFPWSKHLKEHLHSTFKIRAFRDHQKEIINCTMSGGDVFVVMRTGGGKSLTYQLPAILEGLSPARKITLVISPLLSLIRDQEDQMNSFRSGSAISFTSGMAGGAPERSRRWQLVRDPDSGVCVIFVTPEMVHKSNKLRGELEKLNNQGRLGRFVVDEAHCATQWGHDFRPDYTKLGILKQHFPKIPLIAVTATASDRVREDCCRILKIGSPKFFRSSANRPNLKYSVRVKVDKSERVIEDMVSFIKENHPCRPGIVYTFSRKEADTVADKLNSYGISARAYHSSICDSAKESTQRSWMQNKTQIVVATIAFGLGINKPDVRFVIHHTLSKSLEAYYQESGRAGRDGGSADCVLYYSVKDVSRMIGMIHGENGEGSFWSMVRYSQEHGDDALCRRIILSTLGEPGCASIEQVLSQASINDRTEEREVGKHAKTVVRLIQCSMKDMTIQQIVTKWRGKEPPDFVKEIPPEPDLNKDECERLIAALLLSDILYPNVVFTAYASIVYIGLKDRAKLLLNSPNPKVAVRFPIRKATGYGKTSAKKAVEDENGWLSKKKTTTKKKKKKAKTHDTRNKSKTMKSGPSKSITKKTVTEVIDILDDSDDEPPTRKRRIRTCVKQNKKRANIDIFEDSCSDDEFNG